MRTSSKPGSLEESLYACAISKGAERPTNQLGPRTFDLIWEVFQNDLSPRRCTTTHAQYQKWAEPAGNTNSYKSQERRIVPSIWATRYSALSWRSIEATYARIREPMGTALHSHLNTLLILCENESEQCPVITDYYKCALAMQVLF